MTEQPAPQTVAGALRAYVTANLPGVPVYRNSAPTGATAPLAIIIDPIDTAGSDLGDDLLLTELVQVDLYLDKYDTSSTPDALHALMHHAAIWVPGSQIHRVQVTERRVDTNDIDDDGTIRIIYTVRVTRRLVVGDTSTPLPIPVRPDRLELHEAQTTNVHGIADTSKLVSIGEDGLIDPALIRDQRYWGFYTNINNAPISQMVAGDMFAALIVTPNGASSRLFIVVYNTVTGNLTPLGLPDPIAWFQTFANTATGPLKLDANALVPVERIPVLPYDVSGAADAAEAAANAYTDAAIAGLPSIPENIETVEGAQAKADAAEAAANAYTDTQVATAIPLTQKAAANGVATLDADGKVPNAQLPPLAISDTYVVANEAAMLALTAQVGDVAVRSDVSKSFILRATPASTVGNWQELLTPPNAVLSVDGRTGVVSLSDLYDASGAASAAAGAVQSNLDTHAADTTGVHGIADTSALVVTTDSRLSDQRTPTDLSVTESKIVDGAVTSAKIANGTIVNADISATAAIDTTKLSANTVTVDGQAVALGGSINVLPTDGPAGYILAKNSATNFDIAWVPNDTTQVHQYVKNQTGSTITKGSAVYVSGATGANVLISLAQANSDTTSATTLGIVESDIPNGSFGYVVTEGAVTGVNTSGMTEGDPLWLSPYFAGGLMPGFANKPVAPNHLVFMGVVTRAHATQGTIFVKVNNGWELDELHDVNPTHNGAVPLANNNTLIYDSGAGYWRGVTAANLASTVIPDNGLPAAKTTLAALSVHGRPVNSTGQGSSIAASVDGQVLRRSGTTLGFGEVATAGIANNAITTDKIADGNITVAKLATTGATAEDNLVYTGTAWAVEPMQGDFGYASTHPTFQGVSGTSNPGNTTTTFVRVHRGGTISTLGMVAGSVATSTTCILSVYSNTGSGRSAAPSTLLAQTGNITLAATSTSTYYEAALGTTLRVKAGDWFAISFTTATNVVGTSTINALRSGSLAAQSSAGTPPATAAPNVAAVTFAPVIIGLP